MMDFKENCDSFWFKIAYYFHRENKIEPVVKSDIDLVHESHIESERNVDRVTRLIESIITSSHSLDFEGEYCPVTPGFVKGLVEGAKQAVVESKEQLA